MKAKPLNNPVVRHRAEHPETTAKEILAPEFSRSAQRPEAADQRWDWHLQRLLALRDRLLQETAGRRSEATEPLEKHSMSMADSASDGMEHDLNLAGISAEQDLLYEVEEALRRIRSGTYGVCEETGTPIPKARLRAIPWARFNVEVEARLEKSGGIHEPHIGQLGSTNGSTGPSFSEVDLEPASAEDELLQEITLPIESTKRGEKDEPAPKDNRRKSR